MSKEETKKEVKGKARTDTIELHEALEKMIAVAKPAGVEPPTPQPKKKNNTQVAKDE